ncbi:FKBP-type peptidyl-prolyl cis-trans isomerase [Kingella potus]|uniref:FKBP-type peptidyl-prolyl cis-trans isomerase n=1 Tax=Kingella potus TaxID=265175 RepID=UPI001FD078F8|nr:FKBP-type peptidyl-prolyl cis-trans isomerase [Kingella potus]UOP01579.1 FKBP-type peptidyl-prolyl cis-trans isomerase [Kingella potus]
MKHHTKLALGTLAAALALAACKQEAAAPAASAAQPASAASAAAQDPSALGTPEQQVSYAIGMDIDRNIKNMKEQGVHIDLDKFNEAVRAVAEGKTPRLSDQQAQEVLASFVQKEQEKAMAAAEKEAKPALDAAKAWLAENAKKEGVKTTASGLQYKVVKEGTGKQPKPDSMVSVTYTGKLTDGKVFDSNAEAKEPMAFPLPVMIKGWQEALPMMKEGAEYTLYIPPELGYGDAPPPNSSIPKNAVLIFDVKLAATGEMPKDAMVGLPQGEGK